MRLQNNNEPPFIQGLKVARNILTALKEKKLSENPHLNKALARPSLQPEKQNIKLEEKEVKKQQLKEQIVEASLTLQQKLNQIGAELYQCNIQNDTYQTVFDSMSDYYQENYKVIEQNQKLKRSGYELREKIEEFKQKIQKNTEQTANLKIHQAALKQLTTQQLKEYLMLQTIRAEQKILPRIPPSLPTHLQYEQQRNQNKNQENLNLRWQWLSKQVARKPANTRKQLMEQQDIRKSSYGSEMYNI